MAKCQRRTNGKSLLRPEMDSRIAYQCKCHYLGMGQVRLKLGLHRQYQGSESLVEPTRRCCKRGLQKRYKCWCRLGIRRKRS